MKQCFAYVRVSTIKQGEGVSLEAQRDAIADYVERHGLTVTQWFEEQETAAKRGRPVFDEIVKRLNRGEADGLVLHKLDRGARNFADWARIGDLIDQGVTIHIATEAIDFTTRGGRLMADMQMVIATDFIRNNKLEAKKGLYGRLKQGIYPFYAPLGYLNEGKGQPKSVDPIKGPLIQELFAAYASGEHSLRSLTKEMNERGLRNRHGRPLTKASIEKILRNPFYCGLMKIETTGETYQGAHEPLISVARFEAVQAAKAGKCGKKVTKHLHRLRGLFKCALCKTAMIPERQKTYVYYRCHTPNCPTTCVREELLDEAIVANLDRVNLTAGQVSLLTEHGARWNKRYEARSNQERQSLALQLDQLKAREEALTDALLDNLIDKDTFRTRKADIELAKLSLQQKLHEAAPDGPTASDLQNFLELLKSLKVSYEMADPAEQRQLVRWATSNRFVSEKSVEVEPSKWLQQAEEAVSVSSGALARPTPRNSQDISIERLLSAMQSADGEKPRSSASQEPF